MENVSTTMNTRDLTDTFATLLVELVDGPPGEAYMLNGGDPGLLRSLDKLTAADASRGMAGGAPVAAHVDHLRYGLSLMNRWSEGDNPFDAADWSASWQTKSVTEGEWAQLRTELRREAHRWRDALRKPLEVTGTELNWIVASIAHLAYHLGAIRQIQRAARGPAEGS
jgi:hypothetical protein